ncbi:MAG: hypothetical protein HONBIEJF_01293 [Fimbriimonadaceae bacterium]|nr:hypothetical protein [Fimbriimonadaceae bacterium]
MRSIGFGLALALTALSFAQDKVKLEPTAKAGESVKQALEVDYDFGGTVAKLSCRMLTKFKKSTGSNVDKTIDYEDLKVVADENELPLQVSQVEFSLAANGELKELTGGVEGNDNARTYLLIMFIAPDKELAANEKWTFESKGNDKSGIPGYKYEATFVGMEKVGADDAYKYTTKLGESGGGFSVKGTYWVTKDGKVLKADNEFTALMIPAAGAEASGKVRLSLVK